MTYTVSVSPQSVTEEDAQAAMEHFQAPYTERGIALRDARMVSDLFPGMLIVVVEKPHAESAKDARYVGKFVDGVALSFLQEVPERKVGF